METKLTNGLVCSIIHINTSYANRRIGSMTAIIVMFELILSKIIIPIFVVIIFVLLVKLLLKVERYVDRKLSSTKSDT